VEVIGCGALRARGPALGMEPAATDKTHGVALLASRTGETL
jgi:hypothetical protein